MITRREIKPQTSDMGSNYVEYNFSEPMSLGKVLNWVENQMYAWGTITIKFNNGEVLRKFDYDLYNEHSFYYYMSWELKEPVAEMHSRACFMNCDIEIKLVK